MVPRLLPACLLACLPCAKSEPSVTWAKAAAFKANWHGGSGGGDARHLVKAFMVSFEARQHVCSDLCAHTSCEMYMGSEHPSIPTILETTAVKTRVNLRCEGELLELKAASSMFV